MILGSAEGAKYGNLAPKQQWFAEPKAFRAFSAKRFRLVPPGPMAQAFTFRAFGAETQSFTACSGPVDVAEVFALSAKGAECRSLG
jgi:hypothetical protein